MQQILKDKSDAELQAALARIQELETMVSFFQGSKITKKS